MRLRCCSLFAAFVVAVALIGAAFATPATAANDELESVTITGAAGEKPVVAVSKPVSLKTSVAKVLTKGDGDKAKKGATVLLDYVFVNGRTGVELESSYGKGTVSLSLNSSTQPVMVDNLVGARVGSRMMIAIAPKEGMAKALASDTIKKSDTLLFVFDVRETHTPLPTLPRAEGAAVAPVDGLPTVKLAKNGAPTITMPKAAPPTGLVVQPLITGDGPVVQAGQTISVHYTGAIWDSGTVFDSSWKAGREPFPVAIGTGGVIKGWDEGLAGQTVGSQVLLVIPPDLGYGAKGNSDAGIKGTDTLVFVVDILAAT